MNCWNFSLGCRQWKRDAADADDADDAECSRKSKWIKVNPKKVHEVLNFSRFIGDHCRRNDIHHVVDIGAGLVTAQRRSLINDCLTRHSR